MHASATISYLGPIVFLYNMRRYHAIQKEIYHDMIKRVVLVLFTLYLFSCKLAKGESSFCYHLTDSTQLGQGLLPGNYLFYFPRAKKIIWPGIFLHPSPLPLIMKSAAFTAFISCFCGKRLLVADFRGEADQHIFNLPRPQSFKKQSNVFLSVMSRNVFLQRLWTGFFLFKR